MINLREIMLQIAQMVFFQRIDNFLIMRIDGNKIATAHYKKCESKFLNQKCLQKKIVILRNIRKLSLFQEKWDLDSTKKLHRYKKKVGNHWLEVYLYSAILCILNKCKLLRLYFLYL